MNENVFPAIDTVTVGKLSQSFTESGLTKRELFSAFAMMGLIARQVTAADLFADVALKATVHADALIQELAKWK